MQSVLNDVDRFRISERGYKEHGYPFRRGYLLYGETGTGKSSLVDIIYQRHGMAKYVINFSKNMNDGDLINLLASVPANGLIVFDEIGEKFEALKRLTVPSITFGGLKSAIDGTPKLNHGVIVILTTNSLNFLSGNNELCRSGRIDVAFQLTQKFG